MKFTKRDSKGGGRTYEYAEREKKARGGRKKEDKKNGEDWKNREQDMKK